MSRLDDKLAALRAMGKIPEGDVTHVQVSHDSCCAVYKGRKCNCDPDVEVLEGYEQRN